MQSPQLEVLIDAVLRAVRDRLGDQADPQLTQLVVREVVGAVLRDGSNPPVERRAGPLSDSDTPSRAVITASGKNTRGVVATLATIVADAGCDIQDMSQTIVSDFFTLIMIVDISNLTMAFAQVKEALTSAAETQGFHVVVMHEDVMRALQRI
ncbi:MAG: ACT domain-containing protein [Deltaproteobacteria bacterium]|nr:ACT domain-containing protein [Deltaproteobacteria bacterium]